MMWECVTGLAAVGVSRLVRRQSREHRDDDVAIDADDLQICLRTLNDLGYHTEVDWLPVRIELRAPIDALTCTRCFDDSGAGRQAGLNGREQAAEVCAEEAGQFLIEGFELSPSYPARLQAALVGTTVRSCFLGHRSFSADDLASYRGPTPQHESEASRGVLNEAAAWIRLRSQQLREECDEGGLLYLDVGALGFQPAVQQARGHLLGRG